MLVEDIQVYFDQENEVISIKCKFDGVLHITSDVRETQFNKTCFTGVFSKITKVEDDFQKNLSKTLDELVVYKVYTKKTNYQADYLGTCIFEFIGFSEILI